MGQVVFNTLNLAGGIYFLWLMYGGKNADKENVVYQIVTPMELFLRNGSIEIDSRRPLFEERQYFVMVVALTGFQLAGILRPEQCSVAVEYEEMRVAWNLWVF